MTFPRPFPAVSALLFSEKKPGDLATRHLIVEVWLFLFELFPSSLAKPRSKSSSRPPSRPSSVRFDSDPLRWAHVDLTARMREFLSPDSSESVKDQHDFMLLARRPRIFKAWVEELSDICRDYFWSVCQGFARSGLTSRVMCHGSNTLWSLDEVDENLVNKPVAPSGASGGVEFEAMGYAVRVWVQGVTIS